jgi:hypothetical protein
MENKSRLYKLLALTGALPFVASAFMAMAHMDWPAPAALIASSYGLAITSFLCGVHWATYLYRPSDAPVNLFVSSNVIVVAVWLAYLFASLGIALSALIVAFIALLFIDFRLMNANVISHHYFITRVEATALAVLSLIVVIAFVAA